MRGADLPETIVSADKEGFLRSDNGDMPIDRSYIRVKAMLVTPNTNRSRHLVSVKELGARIIGLKHLRIVENIFRFNANVGHEIVALYSGALDPVPADDGGTLTESDGSVVPVVWRPFETRASRFRCTLRERTIGFAVRSCSESYGPSHCVELPSRQT